MPAVSKDDLLNGLKGIIVLNDGNAIIEDAEKLRGSPLDHLLAEAVLNKNKDVRGMARYLIKSAARQLGIFPASIQGLYEARGRGEMGGFTVPAINIRGMSYQLARAIFRATHKIDCGAQIFEIAKSEIGYTFQRPHEYATVILAAAIKENHSGPVFIQGDHFQVNAKKFAENREQELAGLKNLIREAIAAGFYNIDIDTSTLVDLSQPSVAEQQRANFEIGVELTARVRELEQEGITISVGGEIGEVGKENSNPEELKAYMDNFNTCLEALNKGYKSISKISVQTGTSHGGVPLPDGSVAEVKLDFDTLEVLSRISREQYGLAGAVQHGASTLPAELFHRFPELETAEIHLATDFQNMIYESPHFPADLKAEIYKHLHSRFADEKKSGQTDEQFIYKTRKKGFGEFKSAFWNLPEEVKTEIGKEIEARVDFLLDQLNVKNTRQHTDRTIQPADVKPDLQSEIEWS
ncbi:MAG: class II fructose-bisphosphate aldolase [Nitrospinales bacterium]